MNNLQWILVVGQAVGLPALILFYIRDRKKTQAEAALAEGTVKSQIDLSSISAVEAHVGLIQKAFDAERESKDRVIADLEEKLHTAQEEVERQKAKLESMSVELYRLRQKVDTLSDELQAAEIRIQMMLES